MSAEVLLEPNSEKKKEEIRVEFKDDSTLQKYLNLKIGDRRETYPFKQVILQYFQCSNVLISDPNSAKGCD